MLATVLFLTVLAAEGFADRDLVHMIKHGRYKRQTHNCDVLKPACRRAIDSRRQPIRAEPTFRGDERCAYEEKSFWLISTASANNQSCSQRKTNEKPMIRILSDTVEISPTPLRLPSCFNISFEIEVDPSIRQIPNSLFGKNEFQLYELPDVEKMQCQNASTNGCGGYGNNCIYCDICESLNELDRNPVNSDDVAVNRLVKQFDDIRCPRRAGRYKASRRFCFNDWSVLDRDANCQLDMLETLTGADSNAQTLKTALDGLLTRGSSTLIARIYLAHNATARQLSRKAKKEAEIKAEWLARLQDRRKNKNWQVTDAEYNSFRFWYVKFQQDVWHRDQFLPWMLKQNEVACLQTTFSVCDRQPVSVAPRSGRTGWVQQRLKPTFRCPRN